MMKFVITGHFRSQEDNGSIKAGYLNIPVEPYVPNSLSCFRCQKYGHGQNTCHNKMRFLLRSD